MATDDQLAAIEADLGLQRGMGPVLSATTGEPAADAQDFLARVEGDLDLLSELVAIFQVDSSRMLAELRHGVAAGDARAVERSAHALKGSVGNFGGRAAAEAASALERMGRDGVMTGGDIRLAELELEVDRLRSGLVRICEEVLA
jgi:two-component system, sensor histidine kinase and response regulator